MLEEGGGGWGDGVGGDMPLPHSFQARRQADVLLKPTAPQDHDIEGWFALPLGYLNPPEGRPSSKARDGRQEEVASASEDRDEAQAEFGGGEGIWNPKVKNVCVPK